MLFNYCWEDYISIMSQRQHYVNTVLISQTGKNNLPMTTPASMSHWCYCPSLTRKHYIRSNQRNSITHKWTNEIPHVFSQLINKMCTDVFLYSCVHIIKFCWRGGFFSAASSFFLQESISHPALRNWIYKEILKK